VVASVGRHLVVGGNTGARSGRPCDPCRDRGANGGRAGDTTDRLRELPAGQMCNYKVRLADVNDVDGELVAWIRVACEAAG
jgi:hypothetical protein